MTNPVLVDVTRNPQGGRFVESRHRGAIAVVSASGEAVFAAGDANVGVCPRSALKPLQALPMVESGAVEEFGLGDVEIALACASHNGEPRHVQLVTEWLKKIDCSIDQLECGPQRPPHQESADHLVRQGIAFSAVHNNCSGKHASFMTLARMMGVDVSGYTRPDHPVQERVASTISEMIGMDVRPHLIGPDGCHAPNYAVPLEALAHGLARMGQTESLVPARAQAAHRIIAAVEADPYLIAGTGRTCTDLTQHLAGGGLVKAGAEGCFGAILPKHGLGVALKIDDGNARAAKTAIAEVLVQLGVLDRDIDEVTRWCSQPVKDRSGAYVGAIEACPEVWQGFAVPQIGA